MNPRIRILNVSPDGEKPRPDRIEPTALGDNVIFEPLAAPQGVIQTPGDEQAMIAGLVTSVGEDVTRCLPGDVIAFVGTPRSLYEVGSPDRAVCPQVQVLAVLPGGADRIEVAPEDSGLVTVPAGFDVSALNPEA